MVNIKRFKRKPRFARKGNSYFTQHTALHKVDRKTGVGAFYGHVGIVSAVCEPGIVARFLGITDLADGDPETLWLDLLARICDAADAMDTMVLGGDDAAVERTGARIRRAHEDHGVTQEDQVVLGLRLADGREQAQRLLVHDGVDWDALWLHERRLLKLTGVELDLLPEDRDAYRAQLDELDERLELDDPTRELVLNTLVRLPGFPIPLRHRPMMAVLRLVLPELLRPAVRDQFRLPRREDRRGRALVWLIVRLSRVAHVLWRRRTPSMIDFRGMAATARAMRKEIEERR